MTDVERDLIEYQETKLVAANNSTRKKLWELCEQFIDRNGIACAETVYQSDRVIEGAYEFIEQICEIVGYSQVDE